MYDPSIGRWLEEDPLSFEAGDANLYRYVGNGPTNGVDPSGLDYAITIPPGAGTVHSDPTTGVVTITGTIPVGKPKPGDKPNTVPIKPGSTVIYDGNGHVIIIPPGAKPPNNGKPLFNPGDIIIYKPGKPGKPGQTVTVIFPKGTPPGLQGLESGDMVGTVPKPGEGTSQTTIIVPPDPKPVQPGQIAPPHKVESKK